MKPLHPLSLTLAATLALAVVAATAPAHAEGINQLIAVTQMKAQNANDDALAGAEKQRDLVQQQKQIRKRAEAYEQVTQPAPIRQDTTFLYDETQTLK